MRYILTLCIILAAAVAAGAMVVVDAADASSVYAAVVYSKSGLVLGFTDNAGAISNVAPGDFPLTVRTIGYEQQSVATPVDTVRLTRQAHRLGEVVVTASSRPVTKITAYVRQYCSGATPKDTTRQLSEYMVDIFVAPKGTKGYREKDSHPRVRNTIRYTHHTDNEGTDSVARLSEADDDALFSLLDFFITIPADELSEPEAITAGAVADTLQGKYSAKEISTKNNGFYLRKFDYLSDHEQHHWQPWFFKLLGLSVDMTQMTQCVAYAANETGRYMPDDYLYGVFSTTMTGSGKWIKKSFHSNDPVEINCVVEIYPVETTHHTVDEYKELRRDDSIVAFAKSRWTPELPAPMARMVERVNAGS